MKDNPLRGPIDLSRKTTSELRLQRADFARWEREDAETDKRLGCDPGEPWSLAATDRYFLEEIDRELKARGEL